MSERFKVGDLVRCDAPCFAGTPEVYLDAGDLGIVVKVDGDFSTDNPAYKEKYIRPISNWQFMEIHHQRLNRLEVVYKRDWVVVE